MKKNSSYLALAGSGGNPLTIMIAYASSVAIALIGITLLSLKVYKHFQYKIIYYSKYLPKITSILIAFMALSFAVGYCYDDFISLSL